MEGGRDRVGGKKSVIEDCREGRRGLVFVGVRLFEDTLDDVGRG